MVRCAAILLVEDRWFDSVELGLDIQGMSYGSLRMLETNQGKEETTGSLEKNKASTSIPYPEPVQSSCADSQVVFETKECEKFVYTCAI